MEFMHESDSSDPSPRSVLTTSFRDLADVGQAEVARRKVADMKAKIVAGIETTNNLSSSDDGSGSSPANEPSAPSTGRKESVPLNCHVAAWAGAWRALSPLLTRCMGQMRSSPQFSQGEERGGDTPRICREVDLATFEKQQQQQQQQQQQHKEQRGWRSTSARVARDARCEAYSVLVE